MRARKKNGFGKKFPKICIVSAIIIFLALIFLGNFYFLGGNSGSSAENENPAKTNNTAEIFSGGYEVSSGWTVTSYQNLDEKFYGGKKIEVFDASGKSLGFYREDFLKQAMIDGSGNGDGINNSGQHLHYDYQVDDGKTYYLENKSLGAYNNELVPWTGERPSVAVNPPLPYGSEIIFLDLGKDSLQNPDWVNELLKAKVFHADDKFHGWNEKKIDIYVGMQKSIIPGPESLLMRNVTIAIRYPD